MTPALRTRSRMPSTGGRPSLIGFITNKVTESAGAFIQQRSRLAWASHRALRSLQQASSKTCRLLTSSGSVTPFLAMPSRCTPLHMPSRVFGLLFFRIRQALRHETSLLYLPPTKRSSPCTRAFALRTLLFPQTRPAGELRRRQRRHRRSVLVKFVCGRLGLVQRRQAPTGSHSSGSSTVLQGGAGHDHVPSRPPIVAALVRRTTSLITHRVRLDLMAEARQG